MALSDGGRTSLLRGGVGRVLNAAGVGLLGLGLGGAPTVGAFDIRDVLSYQAGPVVLRPHVAVSEQFCDNIYYYSTTREMDLISSMRPGFEAWLGRVDRDVFLRFGYDFEGMFYAEHSDANAENHVFSLRATIKGDRLTSASEYQVQLLSGIYGGLAGFERGSLAGVALERNTCQLVHNLSYVLSRRTSLYGQGEFYAVDFQEGTTLLDLSSFRGTLGFAYQAFPKSTLFGEVHYGQMASGPNVWYLPKAPHADLAGGYVGIRGTFTPKLYGTAKVGYESGTFADGVEAYSSPVAEASLSWQARERTLAGLSYSRRSSLSVQYSRRAIETDMVTARVTQILGIKSDLSATLRASYGHNDYAPTAFSAAQQYNYFGFGADFTYRIRLWLRTSFSYDYERQMGVSKGSIDYDVNRVTLSLVLGY